MKHFKEQINISRQGAEYLAVSICNWLEYRPEPGKDKLTLAELLATSYLFNVKNRLQSAVIRANFKRKLDFNFTFSCQEIFAILLCIPIPTDNSLLRKLLGDLHRKSLNFDYLLKNNQIFYGEKERASNQLFSNLRTS
ncbi:hypothetical protein [Adhaeribacter pallidiroseus]|uniref:Uncharacterized protein n=1 Tax=Adhaeribacter pallidiroseus TaxID=2072847 RepID=A0A369QEE9_9BACT|nr:hypothetical protein [Adhaeribacter pallidiroseus]RDC63303.1 hypothetical protein AHMF7616_01905 [Adhaeribacter pallidiroseus]